MGRILSFNGLLHMFLQTCLNHSESRKWLRLPFTRQGLPDCMRTLQLPPCFYLRHCQATITVHKDQVNGSRVNHGTSIQNCWVSTWKRSQLEWLESGWSRHLIPLDSQRIPWLIRCPLLQCFICSFVFMWRRRLCHEGHHSKHNISVSLTMSDMFLFFISGLLTGNPFRAPE